IGVLAVIEYALLEVSARAPRAPKLAVAAFVGGVAFGGPFRDGTLEVRVAHAATSLAFAHEAPATASGRRVLPPLSSRRARIPNVLYIVTESVRASDYIAPDLFDYARAARVRAHYWSSQSPSFFERDDVASAVDSFVSSDTLLGHVMDDDGEAI